MAIKQEKGDIRDQLKSLGFEESSAAIVERLYDEHQQLTAVLVTQKTPEGRTRIRERMNKIHFRIDKTCDVQRIGNPFKGEAIEALIRERQNVNQKAVA